MTTTTVVLRDEPIAEAIAADDPLMELEPETEPADQEPAPEPALAEEEDSRRVIARHERSTEAAAATHAAQEALQAPMTDSHKPKKPRSRKPSTRMPRLAETTYAQYEAMGTARSLAKLAHSLSAGGGNYSAKLRYVEQLSAKYGWQDLVREYDRAKAVEAGEKWRKHLRELNDEQQKLARAGRAQMFTALSRLARIDMTAIEEAERRIAEWKKACELLPPGATPPPLPRLKVELHVTPATIVAAFSEFAALERLTMGAATEIHAQEEELPIRVILTRDDDDAEQHPEQFPFRMGDGDSDAAEDHAEDSERQREQPTISARALAPADYIAARSAMKQRHDAEEAAAGGSACDTKDASRQSVSAQSSHPFAE